MTYAIYLASRSSVNKTFSTKFSTNLVRAAIIYDLLLIRLNLRPVKFERTMIFDIYNPYLLNKVTSVLLLSLIMIFDQNISDALSTIGVTILKTSC